MKSPISIDINPSLPSNPWHPSVVYVQDGWNGHKYWMVETPFPPFHVPPYRDRWELPCIHFSDDGISWKSIVDNPIDDISPEIISRYGYMSDPHLVLHNNILECYYRLMTSWNGQTIIYKKMSEDGIHWSEREIVADLTDKHSVDVMTFGVEIISPTVVYVDSSCRMYYVDDTFTNVERGVRYVDLSKASSNRHSVPICFNKNVKPWHIDVQYLHGIYYMTIYDVDVNRLSLYSSVDGVHFENVVELLSPSNRVFDFYGRKLYRACLVETTEGCHIYFSASNGAHSYIGLMQLRPNGDHNVMDCLNGHEKLKFQLCIWIDGLKRMLGVLMKYVNKKVNA